MYRDIKLLAPLYIDPSYFIWVMLRPNTGRLAPAQNYVAQMQTVWSNHERDSFDYVVVLDADRTKWAFCEGKCAIHRRGIDSVDVTGVMFQRVR